MMPFQGFVNIHDNFAEKGKAISGILTPYLRVKASSTPVSASNKLFKRYTAAVAFLFIIGSISPVNTFGDSNFASASEYINNSDLGFADTSFLADNDGYISKINPQTDSGDRSTMSDRMSHIVTDGETLSTIAQSYGLKTQTLAWENSLPKNDSIRVGQKLLVPPVDGVTHTVKKGENVDLIAKQYGVQADTIKRQNGLVASTLNIGQNIYVPGGKPLVIDQPSVSAGYRTTPARVGTPSRINNVVASSGGAILPNSNDVPIGDKPFIYPTRGRITQAYHKGHYAIDIADSSMPPIWAAGSGTVIKAVSGCATVSHGCGGGYGNHIIIDHGNGLQTLYGHMTYISLKNGDSVSRGQVIGKMGRTGNVRGRTGIHLHWEVRKNGVKQVPSKYY